MTDERFKQEILNPLNEVYLILKRYKDAKDDEGFKDWVSDINKILKKDLPCDYNAALYRVLISCGDIISKINRGEL